MKAADYLRQAAEVIEQRGQLRDKPDGERSMERAVDAYITLNGPVMQTEMDGWVFMCILKLARATAGKPHGDDWTDLAGYAALAAECVEKDCKPAPQEEEAILSPGNQTTFEVKGQIQPYVCLATRKDCTYPRCLEYTGGCKNCVF